MGAQADRNTALRHTLPDFENLFLAAQEYDVDREVHPERMDRLTGGNPQSLAAVQTLVLQKSRPAATAIVGYDNFAAQKHTASCVPHLHHSRFD
jgi:hypothetical protein